jgi:hypothetical protein
VIALQEGKIQAVSVKVMPLDWFANDMLCRFVLDFLVRLTMKRTYGKLHSGLFQWTDPL